MRTRNLFAALLAALAMITTSCESGEGSSQGGGLSDLSFDIMVTDISAAGATVAIEPSDKTVMYYFDKVEKRVYQSFDNDVEFMNDRIATLKEWCESQSTSVVANISVGDDTYAYNGQLTPNTEYYIFAFGVDSSLKPNTTLTLKSFRTEDIEASTNTFTISENDGVITVIPTNYDPYFWDVVPSEEYAGKSDEYIMNDLIEYYKSEGALDYYIVQGTDSYDFSDWLSSGETYTVYCFGFNGIPTTAMTKFTFTYAGGTDDSTTNLTGDITMVPLYAEALYYGNYYKNNTNNWMIYLWNESEELGIECLSAPNAATPVGTYTITAFGENNVAGDAFAGDFYDDGSVAPSYYMAGDGEYATTWALVESGTLSISASGSNYNIVVTFADALGNRINANFSGAMDISEGKVESSSVATKSALNRIRARHTLRNFSSVAKSYAPKTSLKSVRTK